MRLPGWIDRDEREPAAFPAILTLSDGTRYAVTITNASTEGCRVELNGTVPIKAAGHLKVGSERIAVEVRWSLHGSAGLQLRDDQ